MEKGRSALLSHGDVLTLAVDVRVVFEGFRSGDCSVDYGGGGKVDMVQRIEMEVSCFPGFAWFSLGYWLTDRLGSYG